MNDILFGNNNSKVITKLSKRYFKKNKVRNLAALLAIILTAFLFTSITSLAFNMASSIQLSLQMQKGSKADGTLGYMTEKQYEQLVNSDFVDQAGHRRIIGYASNTSSHSIEINYEDSVQQELTFCVPTHGAAPEKANEIATTDLALKALGVEPEIGAEVPLEFELRGKTYHYDMVLSGWWEASNDSVSVATVSEQFIKENPDVVQNTYAVDHVMSGVTFSDVVLKNKANVQQQLNEFVYSIGGNPEDMGADNFILASENQMSQGLTSSESIVPAVVFILMFVVCGYLLIYNIFDISVMQDVRQYGLLRTIGTSTRQIKSIFQFPTFSYRDFFQRTFPVNHYPASSRITDHKRTFIRQLCCVHQSAQFMFIHWGGDGQVGYRTQISHIESSVMSRCGFQNHQCVHEKFIRKKRIHAYGAFFVEHDFGQIVYVNLCKHFKRFCRFIGRNAAFFSHKRRRNGFGHIFGFISKDFSYIGF